MRFGLYQYTSEGQSIAVESDRDMSSADGVFNEAWSLDQPGDFEIVISDVATQAVLATERVSVD